MIQTAEQILEIVERHGTFFVAPHYRFDSLRTRCNRLVTKGKLCRSHWKQHGRYGDWYKSVPDKNR
jgi:predicted dehydrogenase